MSEEHECNNDCERCKEHIDYTEADKALLEAALKKVTRWGLVLEGDDDNGAGTDTDTDTDSIGDGLIEIGTGIQMLATSIERGLLAIAAAIKVPR